MHLFHYYAIFCVAAEISLASLDFGGNYSIFGYTFEIVILKQLDKLSLVEWVAGHQLTAISSQLCYGQFNIFSSTIFYHSIQNCLELCSYHVFSYTRRRVTTRRIIDSQANGSLHYPSSNCAVPAADAVATGEINCYNFIVRFRSLPRFEGTISQGYGSAAQRPVWSFARMLRRRSLHNSCARNALHYWFRTPLSRRQRSIHRRMFWPEWTFSAKRSSRNS